MGCNCGGNKFRQLNRPSVPARQIVRAVNTAQQTAGVPMSSLPPLGMTAPPGGGEQTTLSQERRRKEKLRRDAILSAFGKQ